MIMDPSDERPDSAAVLESMTLLATLSTAAEVGTSVTERRRGRDPAAQARSDLAAARMQTAGDELMELLMQLVLGRVPLEQESEPPLAHAVRHFDLLLKLQRAKRLVHTMHQHLLSLYPNVSESLVEEARRVHTRLRRLGEDTSLHTDKPELPDVLERALAFVVWSRHEVGA